MHLLTLQRLVAVCAILLCSTTQSLQAQVTYQGLLEGIYPARLVVEDSNPKATLTISSGSNQINFIGGCNDGNCKYRGVDTSLALVFERSNDRITGRMQNGSGTSKAFIAEQVDADTPFASTCENTFWLRAWMDASEKHHLTLATLPGKQVKGTFYVAELGTSFSVSGTTNDTQLDLTLEGTANKKIGKLTGQTGSATMEATLNLDGSKTTIEFAMTEEMSLNCLQANGQYDIVHPVVEGTRYASLPIQLWKEIGKQRADYSHAWFEPTLFNANVISGWMHLESPSGHTSKPINLLRDKNGKLKQGKLLGGKRTKTQLVSVQKERAVAQHPLRADEDFQAWAAALDFSKFTLTVEGLSLASERHPVYGQLESLLPWRELPKSENLPVWLTQSN
ncbi:MAG: hypothetical protein AB8F78_13420 [Saprospiraceae bacterium]